MDILKIRYFRGNDKYENYSKNFENVFSKAILDNNLRKSIEKNKNNDNNSNILQNENTTDSFKKNKINVSFIENQNQNNLIAQKFILYNKYI